MQPTWWIPKHPFFPTPAILFRGPGRELKELEFMLLRLKPKFSMWHHRVPRLPPGVATKKRNRQIRF